MTFHLENHSLTREKVLAVHPKTTLIQSEFQSQLDIITTHALLSNCKIQSNAISSKKYLLGIGEGFICSIPLSDDAFVISKSETKRKYWVPVEEFEYRNCYWVEKTDTVVTMKKLHLPGKERFEFVTQAVEISIQVPKSGKKVKTRAYILLATNLGKLYSMRRKGLSSIALVRNFEHHIRSLYCWSNDKFVYIWIYLANGTLYEFRSFMNNVVAAAKRCSSSAGGHGGKKWEHPFRFISNSSLEGFMILREESLQSEIGGVDAPVSYHHQQPLKFIFDPEEEVDDESCPPCAWALQVSPTKIYHGPIIIDDEDRDGISTASTLPQSSMTRYECRQLDHSQYDRNRNGGDILDYSLTPHHIIVSKMEATGIFIIIYKIAPRYVSFSQSSTIPHARFRKEDIVLKVPIHSKQLNAFCHSGHFALLEEDEWNHIYLFGSNNILVIKFSTNEQDHASQLYSRRAMEVLQFDFTKVDLREKKQESDYYFRLGFRCANSQFRQQNLLKKIALFAMQTKNFMEMAEVLAGTDYSIEEASHVFLSGQISSPEESLQWPSRNTDYSTVIRRETNETESLRYPTQLKIERIKGLRNYLMIKCSFKKSSFSLFEVTIPPFQASSKRTMTEIVLWILDLYLLEEHLVSNIGEEWDQSELFEYVLILGEMSSEIFDATPCYYLLMNKGYEEEALRLAEKHQLSEQLIEHYTISALYSPAGIEDVVDSSEVFYRLQDIENRRPEKKGMEGRDYHSTHDSESQVSALNLIKQGYNHDPVKAIQWLEYSSQDSNDTLVSSQHKISDLISLCPIMWNPDTFGIKSRSKDVLLPYFMMWSQVGKKRGSSNSYRLSTGTAPSIHGFGANFFNLSHGSEEAIHSCSATLVCLHEMLSRSTPLDIIHFLHNISSCTSCVTYVLRKAIPLHTNFTTLALSDRNEGELTSDFDDGTQIIIHPTDEKKELVYKRVNCSHIASICLLHLQQYRLAIKHCLFAAAELYHNEIESNSEVNVVRRYFLSMARKIANQNFSHDDNLSTEVEEHREDLWSYLIDEFCNLYSSDRYESEQHMYTLKQAQFSTDLSSFLVESQRNTTPIRATAKIISLLPPRTLVSSFKQNMTNYFDKVSQEMAEIKEDSESHASLLKELKHMAFSNNQFKVELTSTCSCSSPLCTHPRSLLDRQTPKDILTGTKRQSQRTYINDLESIEPISESRYVYTFSCGHNFHSACIEELILSFPSHEDILRYVEEKGLSIQLFPMRHAITKLTLQQLNRRNLFFERAAEYARSQGMWKKNSQKYLNTIFKRCLKQLVIESKKHQLFRHECPLCNGMFTASTVIPFPKDKSWDINTSGVLAEESDDSNKEEPFA